MNNAERVKNTNKLVHKFHDIFQENIAEGYFIMDTYYYSRIRFSEYGYRPKNSSIRYFLSREKIEKIEIGHIPGLILGNSLYIKNRYPRLLQYLIVDEQDFSPVMKSFL